MTDRKVTLKDIANDLGLSPTTVSLTLNQRESNIPEATQERIFDAARRMGYLRRPTLIRQKDWLNVALVSQAGASVQLTSFFSEVSRQLQNRMGSQSMRLLHLVDDPNFLEAALHQVDVVLTSSASLARSLEAQGQRSLVIQGDSAPDLVSVNCDDEGAGRIMAEHALELGHRRASLVFPPIHGRCISSRHQGFVERFKAGEGTICPLPKLDLQGNLREVLHKALQKKQAPTFLFCFADNLVFQVHRCLRLLGFDVPKDLSVAGVDDLHWGRLTHPAFSTVNLSEGLFADRVMEAIRHLQEGGAPYQVLVPTQLVARQTTSQPPPPR